MLAANNLTEIFDYLYPVVAKKMGSKVEEICNKQNSTGNTPLRTSFSIKIMQSSLIAKRWSSNFCRSKSTLTSQTRVEELLLPKPKSLIRYKSLYKWKYVGNFGTFDQKQPWRTQKRYGNARGVQWRLLRRRISWRKTVKCESRDCLAKVVSLNESVIYNWTLNMDKPIDTLVQ